MQYNDHGNASSDSKKSIDPRLTEWTKNDNLVSELNLDVNHILMKIGKAGVDITDVKTKFMPKLLNSNIFYVNRVIDHLRYNVPKLPKDILKKLVHLMKNNSLEEVLKEIYIFETRDVTNKITITKMVPNKEFTSKFEEG